MTLCARGRRLTTFGAALALLLPVSSRSEVRSGTFAAPSLGGREVRYVADVPASYATGDRTYPVVYALHGLFEEAGFWERRGLAPLLARAREQGQGEFLVVAVDASNSFFVNGRLGRYQDLVAEDLVAYVEKAFRVRPGRGSRALLGVSMGGYGALRMGLLQPERFAAVATHSAMLLTAIPTAEDGARRGQMNAFYEAFGNPIDAKAWSAADPLVLAASAEARTAPALYFDCGAADRYGLQEGNKKLHEVLTARRIPHTFELPPGDHGYDFVRSRLAESLSFLDRALRGPAPERSEP
jgi:S-formylglutathione hydrolase FrmB